MKALDLSAAFQTPDPTKALESMLKAYNFERELLAACRLKAFDRVALPIADGIIPKAPPNRPLEIPYLMFDLAESDVRRYLSISHAIDVAWVLRSIHHMSVGLKQLHSQGIAHQDLKPSNALVFGNQITKIADLGRAWSRNMATDHDDLSVAGDAAYAPPELLYDYVSTERNVRRYGCDVYLLGSMIVFMFTKVSAVSLLFSHLHQTMWPNSWGGTYQEVLPFLRSSFNEGLREITVELPGPYREKLLDVVRQLCEPNPENRGDPTNRGRGMNPFDLQRYVTALDVMARRAEYSISEAMLR